MSKKLQAEVEKSLKEIRFNIDLYDKKWEELLRFNQNRFFEKFKFFDESRKEIMRGKKHAIRTATLELMDYKHVNDAKAKIENDLEGILRKLHRLKQQLVEWNSNHSDKDLRNKEELVEYRKSIELRYKRGKAFYKHGSSSENCINSQNSQLNDTQNWMNDFIQKLNQQSFSWRTEIEELSANKNKTTEVQDRISQLNAMVDLHQMNIKKLEGILGALVNEKLKVDDSSLDRLKRELEPYIENNEEMSIVVTEDVYTELGFIIEETKDCNHIITEQNNDTQNISNIFSQTYDNSPLISDFESQSLSHSIDSTLSSSSRPSSESSLCTPILENRFFLNGTQHSLFDINNDSSKNISQSIKILNNKSNSSLSNTIASSTFLNLEDENFSESKINSLNEISQSFSPLWNLSTYNNVNQNFFPIDQSLLQPELSIANASSILTNQNFKYIDNNKNDSLYFASKIFPSDFGLSSSVISSSVFPSTSNNATHLKTKTQSYELTSSYTSKATESSSLNNTQTQMVSALPSNLNKEPLKNTFHIDNMSSVTDSFTLTSTIAFPDNNTSESGLIIIDEATQDWSANDKNQLSVVAGQKLFIQTRHSSGWTYGYIRSDNGKNIFGWFPSNICKSVKNRQKRAARNDSAFPTHSQLANNWTKDYSEQGYYIDYSLPKSSYNIPRDDFKTNISSTASSTLTNNIDNPKTSSNQVSSEKIIQKFTTNSQISSVDFIDINTNSMIPLSTSELNSNLTSSSSLYSPHQLYCQDNFPSSRQTYNLIPSTTSDSQNSFIDRKVSIVQIIPDLLEVKEVKWNWNGELTDGSDSILLKFRKGEKVEILAHHISGWIFGRIHEQPDRLGWFPDYMLREPNELISSLIWKDS